MMYDEDVTSIKVNIKNQKHGSAGDPLSPFCMFSALNISVVGYFPTFR